MLSWPSPVVAAATPDPSQPARELVARVLDNMSAGTDVAHLPSIEFDAHEMTWDLVENDHPVTAPFYDRSADDIRRGLDYDRGIGRTDTLRDGQIASTSLLAGRRSVTLTGTGEKRKQTVATAPPSWQTRDPVAALRMAMQAPGLILEPDVTDRGIHEHVVSFRQGQYPVRLFIDAMTMLPAATEAVVSLDDQHLPEAIAWNALGDVRERTEYMNWQFSGGIRYPFQQDEMRDGDLLRSLTIRSVKVGVAIDAGDAGLGSLSAPAPASVQDFRPSSAVPGPDPHKPIAEIAPGVVQIPNAWFSVIVRQPDGLVIIDAPISAGYSKGVLDEAARRFPGVPVKALVTSTGFFWHVAGIREYAARGIPIYAEARNVPVIRRILSSPHSQVPDSLERTGRHAARVIPVSAPTSIGSGANAMTLYPVTMATQPMVMTYIGGARLLHTGEMVQPLGPGGSILFPESLIELSDTVRNDGLSVDRIIGMHMSPTPWAAVAETLQKAGAGRPATEHTDATDPPASAI